MDERQRERRWAAVRIALGMLQVTGAFTTILLLAQTGTSTLTIAVGCCTAVFLVTSLLLFKGK